MTPARAVTATAPELADCAEAIAAEWERAGAGGWFLARNLDTGAELGFDADAPVPLSSVVKVAIALVVLDAIARGELDGAAALTVDPAGGAVGPTGLGACRHPARVAIEDLVMLMLTLSDNAAADALLSVLEPAAVDAALRGWGLRDVRVRHRLARLQECAADASGGDTSLALALAVNYAGDGPHPIETLDPARTNAASARGCVELLAAIWDDAVSDRRATARLRRLMEMQVHTQRLAGELRSESVRVSGKTGTFLHLRHEIGVVQSDDGARVALAALTAARRPVRIAPDIDLAIGAAGRIAFSALR